MSFQIYVTLETNLLLYMLIRKLNLCFRANPLVPIINIRHALIFKAIFILLFHIVSFAVSEGMGFNLFALKKHIFNGLFCSVWVSLFYMTYHAL